jgi:hypothetical protein
LRQAVPVVAAITAALVATDWPGDLTSGFWERHPMFSGIVSGALLLTVGYVVVEVWIQRSSARKWEVVRGIGFKSLGKAADDIRLGMHELITGRVPPYGSSHFPPSISKALERVVARHAASLPQERLGHRLPRVAVLFDREWAELAVEGLDVLKQRHREHMAAWSAVMLATDDLARVFNEIGDLNERVFRLQAPLRQLRDERSDPRQLRNDIIEAWKNLAIETVFVQEQLMRAAVGPSWTHFAGREWLLPAWRKSLDERRPFDVPPFASRPEVSPDEATGRA